MLSHATQAIQANYTRMGDVPAANTDSPGFFGCHPTLITSEHFYDAEEEIYGEGEPAEFVYQVVRGAVRTYKILTDGRRQIGAFHLPGDVFGLVSDTTHNLTAEAIIDTTVRMVRRGALQNVAKTDVRVACDLWAVTAADLRHAEEHMLLLGRKSTMEKVIAFLLEMDRRLAGTGMLSIPMPRRDIGDYLGLAFETVSRTLSRLHGEGMLSFSGARQITLHDRQKLSGMNA